MLFFKPTETQTVGLYTPSENFNQYVHFSVMNEDSEELQATCGYFCKVSDAVITPDIEDYKHYFECIEQAKIYANAPRMINFLLEMAEDNGNVAEFLESILNIEEPVRRLLGEGAVEVLNAI